MRKSDGFAHALPGVMVFGCFCLGAALQTLAMKRSELSVNYILVLGLEAALALVLSIALLEKECRRANSGASHSSWRGSWLCGGKSRGKPRRQRTAARTLRRPCPDQRGAKRSARPCRRARGAPRLARATSGDVRTRATLPAGSWPVDASASPRRRYGSATSFSKAATAVRSAMAQAR